MESDDFKQTGLDSWERLRNLYLQPGDVIAGNYEFVRELGHGGMGMVCLCRDLVANGRLMAVKTVPDLLRNDEEAVAALTREYDNMYSLTNDGIVAVRHLVKDDFRYYVVMDYAEGETLAAYLAKHRKPGEAVALAVVRRIAEALDYAHGSGHGLVHRDVKPGNVMVQIDGEEVKSVKLLDFGLGLQIKKSFSRTTGQLTGGTPTYKSPEQWDPRRYGKPSFNSDQYSLAAMTYEMLSGDYPFAEYEDMETFRVAVLNDEPERISGIADYVNDALRKALSKKPEDRFKNCMAFADALKQLPAVVASPLPSSPRSVIVIPSQPQIEMPCRPEPSVEKNSLTFTLSGGIPLELVHIPAGTFLMGLPESENRYGDAKLHHVTLTNDYWLGKFPVTQEQYQTITKQNPSTFKSATRPVENVDWNYAKGFCDLLNNVFRDKLPSGYVFTLPTEAQWEYACRAGTSTSLNSNQDMVVLGDYGNNSPNLDEVGWYAGNSGVDFELKNGCDVSGLIGKQYNFSRAGSHSVGLKKPNAWGLYDMHGNVSEWCRDSCDYNDKVIVTDTYKDGITDPLCSNGTHRIFRGGAWSDPARCCSSGNRNLGLPFNQYDYLGFRVALAPVSAVSADSLTPSSSKKQEGLISRIMSGLNLFFSPANESKETRNGNLSFTLPGGIPLELIHIPNGTFMMGSPSSEPGHYDNEIQHRVTLTKDFWLGKFLLTQEQYQAITKQDPSEFKGATRPVECVNWNDAKGYCDLLNNKFRGKLPAGYTFTLPTEAQWEYACRAGTTTPFNFGSMLNGDKANCNGNYPYGMGKGKYVEATTEVGKYAANAWGLYDMHGNVSEWCKDWYEDYPRYAMFDPEGGASGQFRVLRGGTWCDYAGDCRSASRRAFVQMSRSHFAGFRVALVPVQ